MTDKKTTRAQCKGQTRSGQRCRMKPTVDGLCFNHSPKHAAKRAEARRNGGLAQRTPHAGKPETIPADVQTIDQARAILNYTLAELLTMDNSIPRARALLAAFDSFIRAFEIGALEERIAALEAMQK